MSHFTLKNSGRLVCAVCLPAVVIVALWTMGARPAGAANIDVSNPANLLSSSDTTAAAGGSDAGSPSAVLDGLAPDDGNDAPFLFHDTTGDFLSVSGFSAPKGIADLRFFIAPSDTERVPNQIVVYASSSLTNLTSPGSYTLVQTFNEPNPNVPSGTGWGYTAYSTSPAADRGYFDLTFSDADPIPAGTQSLLIELNGSTPFGPRLYELQAFAPVPEPSSIVAFLGLAGMAGLAVARRAIRHCTANPGVKA